MSWGSEAASAADTVSTAADGASTAIGGAAGTGGSIYGQMADISGTAGAGTDVGANGFALGSTSTPTVGPTVDAANLQTYGTATPSWFDKAGVMYDRFTKGQNADLGGFMKNFGNNPETYGKAYGLLSTFARGGGGGGTPQPANITNYYQQPQSEYLRKRGY